MGDNADDEIAGMLLHGGAASLPFSAEVLDGLAHYRDTSSRSRSSSADAAAGSRLPVVATRGAQNQTGRSFHGHFGPATAVEAADYLDRDAQDHEQFPIVPYQHGQQQQQLALAPVSATASQSSTDAWLRRVPVAPWDPTSPIPAIEQLREMQQGLRQLPNVHSEEFVERFFTQLAEEGRLSDELLINLEAFRRAMRLTAVVVQEQGRQLLEAGANVEQARAHIEAGVEILERIDQMDQGVHNFTQGVTSGALAVNDDSLWDMLPESVKFGCKVVGGSVVVVAVIIFADKVVPFILWTGHGGAAAVGAVGAIFVKVKTLLGSWLAWISGHNWLAVASADPVIRTASVGSMSGAMIGFGAGTLALSSEQERDNNRALLGRGRGSPSASKNGGESTPSAAVGYDSGAASSSSTSQELPRSSIQIAYATNEYELELMQRLAHGGSLKPADLDADGSLRGRQLHQQWLLDQLPRYTITAAGGVVGVGNINPATTGDEDEIPIEYTTGSTPASGSGAATTEDPPSAAEDIDMYHLGTMFH
ncbi:unnamed protein product [Amoebophrya sp. A120]|nr:unnamed protein product [Amoebophrya sp. A120]|eukprot:GSA120T00023141001.1